MRSIPGRTRFTFIAERAALAVLLWLAFFPLAKMQAHPVAQGTMTVVLAPGKMTVEARITTEEIFVASTFAVSTERNPSSLSAVWNAHGPYLLAHLRVFADDRLLTGRVTSVQPPSDSSLPGTSDFVVYRLEYLLADAGSVPAHLRMEEDVLKEATSPDPANTWTATYVVRIEAPGVKPVEGLQLERGQPIDYPSPAPRVGIYRLRVRQKILSS